MSYVITFDIYPSNTIIFSAPVPHPAQLDAELIITTPDDVVISYTASTVALVAATDFDDAAPGEKINITVADINATSGIISKAGTPLTTLPWTKFPPGVYTISYEVPGYAPVYTEDFLAFTTIDDCLYSKVDGFMYDTCCDKCKGSETKQLVEKLLAVKEGAKLDFKYTAYADLEEKLSALQHLCEGDFCECSCGC